MKKIVSVLLAVIILCSLCACNNKGNDVPENSNTQNSDTEKGNVVDNTATKEQQPDKEVRKISLNEEFSVADIMTISLNSSEWCNDILPSNTSGSGYLYKKGTDGEIFFVVHGTLKNLASEEFNVQYCSLGEMLVNGKYKVPLTLELEESGGTSFSASVKPLQTLNLIVYGSVSEELYNTYEQADLTINIVNTEENLTYFYDDDYPHDTFSISFSK